MKGKLGKDPRKFSFHPDNNDIKSNTSAPISEQKINKNGENPYVDGEKKEPEITRL
jgi:hypothetical protein